MDTQDARNSSSKQKKTGILKTGRLMKSKEKKLTAQKEKNAKRNRDAKNTRKIGA